MKFITKTVDQLRNDAYELIGRSRASVKLANDYDAHAQRLIANRRAFRKLAKEDEREDEREAQRLRELANKLESQYK